MPTERDNIIQRLWWKAAVGYDDMREAAEFEARVSAKLASYAATLSRDIGCNDCPCHKTCTRYENKNISCKDVFLKTAYLAIEEEMDAKLDK